MLRFGNYKGVLVTKQNTIGRAVFMVIIDFVSTTYSHP